MQEQTRPAWTRLGTPATPSLPKGATIVNDTDSPLETRQRFPIVALLIGFAVLDFLAEPVVELSGWQLMGLLPLGLIGGQLALLAIWAVLGPQRWIVRLPVTFGLTLLLFLVLVSGMILTDGTQYAARDTRTALLVPLLFLAVQSPLWILRMALGCRILHAATETDASSMLSRQFGLSHLLGAMAVIAVALGLASLGKQDTGTWAELLIMCLVFATWSALSTLPCLWAALVARNKRISTLAIVAYVLVLTLVVLLVSSVLGGSAPPSGIGLAVLLLCAALMGSMLAVLHIVRKRGFVLVRWKSEERAAGEDSPSGTGPGEPQASSGD
jgi:hypothetical protein